MSPFELIETALLLGLFVAAGGGYCGLYAIGRLRGRAGLVYAGRACWAVAFALALAIAVLTPLDAGWKLLILASAAVYAVIPPVTWRYLERLHVEEPHPGANR